VINYPLSVKNKNIVRVFLRQFSFTRSHYDFSYSRWYMGGRGWDRTFCSGGTDTMNALMWYHHIYKPGSKEWRPKIIMNALCNESGIEENEGT